MSNENQHNYQIAIRDFKRARKQAAVQHLLAQLTGKSDSLLAYDYVHRQLRGKGNIERGIQEIPLDSIIGSVGRYDDFTRDFLPKKDSNQERWAKVKATILNMTGMSPISVYQIGDAYFVRDGNHRVSVAKQLGTDTISARVTEVKTKVPLKIDDDLEEVICKAQYADFIDKTKIDEIHPEANLLLTFCDHYQVLFSQITAHQKKLKKQNEDEIDFHLAVSRWYEDIYMPVVEIIREQGTLHHFPQRTEADLYLLFVEHQEELVNALGWHIDTDSTVIDLIEKKTGPPRNIFSWLGLQLYNILLPEELVPGSGPGHWRTIHVAQRKRDSLFANILVGIQKESANWYSLEQAVVVAKRENSYLYGLHVVSDKTEKDQEDIDAVRAEFEQRCMAEGLTGEFAVEKGNVAQTLLKRAGWVDLVVVSLTQPMQSQAAKRFGAGFNMLVQRCPRPLLVVPDGAKKQMDRVLLAYDGSPKANEALFVAAYLKSRWSIPLTVVTVETNYTEKSSLDRAKNYLDNHGDGKVNYKLMQRPIRDAILKTAEEEEINFLIMGGFGFRPVLNLMLGSTVDHVLREFNQPVLICR